MKSIMQDERKCFISGCEQNLHKHHVYHGTAQRKISEDNGFWCYLTGALHNQSTEGVHCRDGHELDLALKEKCQEIFEETHTRSEFMSIVGRNYLD